MQEVGSQAVKKLIVFCSYIALAIGLLIVLKCFVGISGRTESIAFAVLFSGIPIVLSFWLFPANKGSD